MVLDNTREAVIAHSTEFGIKFFNQAGQKILERLAQHLPQDDRNQYDKELELVKQKQRSLKQDATVPAESMQLQEKLFAIQMFEDFQKDGKEIDSQQKKKHSFNELMQMNNEVLAVSVFSVMTRTNSKQFISVKVSSLQLNHSNFKVINILDQTVSIQFDKSKGEKKILQLINACFSHQLRNPINSLLVANLKFRNDCLQLRHLMTTQGIESIDASQIMRVVDAMIVSIDSQDSQTQLLHFYVSDLLCMAEI